KRVRHASECRNNKVPEHRKAGAITARKSETLTGLPTSPVDPHLHSAVRGLKRDHHDVRADVGLSSCRVAQEFAACLVFVGESPIEPFLCAKPAVVVWWLGRLVAAGANWVRRGFAVPR